MNQADFAQLSNQITEIVSLTAKIDAQVTALHEQYNHLETKIDTLTEKIHAMDLRLTSVDLVEQQTSNGWKRVADFAWKVACTLACVYCVWAAGVKLP